MTAVKNVIEKQIKAITLFQDFTSINACCHSCSYDYASQLKAKKWQQYSRLANLRQNTLSLTFNSKVGML